jgi:hypothetical protein
MKKYLVILCCVATIHPNVFIMDILEERSKNEYQQLTNVTQQEKANTFFLPASLHHTYSEECVRNNNLYVPPKRYQGIISPKNNYRFIHRNYRYFFYLEQCILYCVVESPAIGYGLVDGGHLMPFSERIVVNRLGTFKPHEAHLIDVVIHANNVLSVHPHTKSKDL